MRGPDNPIWTRDEVRRLQTLQLKHTCAEIARQMGRTVSAVQNKQRRLRHPRGRLNCQLPADCIMAGKPGGRCPRCQK